MSLAWLRPNNKQQPQACDITREFSLQCTVLIAVIAFTPPNTAGKCSPEWEKHRAQTVSNEQMVYDYFRLIDKKDLEGLLRLFAEDVIIYEPFSKEGGGLRGKDAIKDFLQITIMANAGTSREIEFTSDSSKTEQRETSEITALVTFQGDGALKGKFSFKFVIEIEVLEDSRGFSMTLPSKKIKELRIQIIK
jgi:ketosteroid isomerase-like protein